MQDKDRDTETQNRTKQDKKNVTKQEKWVKINKEKNETN